jgi:hypothetical protein
VPSIPKNHPALEALHKGLRELGYVEGQNIKYEYRSAQGHATVMIGIVAVVFLAANIAGSVAAGPATGSCGGTDAPQRWLRSAASIKSDWVLIDDPRARARATPAFRREQPEFHSLCQLLY